MADDGSPVTDSDIALMMATGDQAGLRLLLERHGWRIKAFLVKYYSSVLQQGELNEALNTAVFNIWRFADRYHEGKGSLPSWCIRIAQNSARSIIRREFSYRSKNLEYDATYDPAGDLPDEQAAEISARATDDPRLEDLHKAIGALPPLQKAIIKADLAAGGLGDAGRLAAIHGTSKNTIYVSRHKAIEALKKRAEQFGRRPLSKRSNHDQRG
jgi:RNA polymerase sigma factor (sigma-70 family)